MNFSYKKLFLSTVIISAAFTTAAGSSPSIFIDCTGKGANVNPGMYGIFFEEISHAGEGGLYGELLCNRNFEEHVLPSGMMKSGDYEIKCKKLPAYSDQKFHEWKNWWNTDNLPMMGWKVEGSAKSEIVSDNPLHPETPHALRLAIEENGAYLVNEGYNGVPVVKGDKYDVRFYICPASYSGVFKAQIVSSDGRILCSKAFTTDKTNEWKEYRAVLSPGVTDPKASFRLEFESTGTVDVDYVSLFPQKTFKGRKNGMRRDVAQMLADLKPGFVRWPGGCNVEGATLENRFQWKKTIGDPMTRHSEWILWGYHCSWGFGYHEFLQFCEDLGADPLLVLNVGLSCELRNGDYTDDLDSVIRDIEDAIEYAQGDVSTVWGAKRAEAGHPKPFKLKYIELGNEHFGDFYADRYNKLYSVLKPKYPDITFITTLGLGETADALPAVDMIDPHWYVKPEFFYENSDIFDTVRRGKYDVYVGEFAVNQNVGSGNMDAALAEAAFITGLERNSDLVKLASYAPLLENSNMRNWSTNLIWMKPDSVIGRSSYYVQKMYSNNVPTYNLPVRFVDDKYQPDSLARHYVVAGYDEISGETVVKVVNGTEQPFTANLRLNCSSVSRKGKVITLRADSLTDENSFDNPFRISPVVSEFDNFDKNFSYTFEPASFTILRIKTKNR